MSDLVGNPEDRFSRVAAQMIMSHILTTQPWRPLSLYVISELILLVPKDSKLKRSLDAHVMLLLVLL